MTDTTKPTLITGSRGTVAMLAGGAMFAIGASLVALLVVLGVLNDTQGERDGFRAQLERQNTKIDCLSQAGTRTNLALLASESAQNQLILGGFKSEDVSTSVAGLEIADRRVKEAEASVANLKQQCNLE